MIIVHQICALRLLMAILAKVIIKSEHIHTAHISASIVPVRSPPSKLIIWVYLVIFIKFRDTCNYAVRNNDGYTCIIHGLCQCNRTMSHMDIMISLIFDQTTHIYKYIFIITLNAFHVCVFLVAM